MIRPDAEHRVERLHRHLRRLALGDARGSLGGAERGGLVPALPGQLHQGEPPLGAPGRLAPALAHDGLGPERRGAPRTAAGERLQDVERVLVGGRVGDQQAEQPLQGEGVCLLGARPAEVRLAGLPELACGDQRLGLGERPGSLEGEQQLLVEQGGRRQRAGGKAKPESERRDLHAGEPCPFQRGHPEPARHGGQGDELGQDPGGEAVGAPQLDVGKGGRALGRPRQQQRNGRRGRGRESVHPDVVEVDGESLPVGVEGDLERRRRRRGALQPGLPLEPALAKVQDDVRDLERRGGRLLDGAADQLGVDRHLEKAEVELPALVLLDARADVEGEADVGDLQPEVDHRDARAQLDRRESDECPPVQQSQLGPGNPTVCRGRDRASGRVLGSHERCGRRRYHPPRGTPKNGQFRSIGRWVGARTTVKRAPAGW